MSDNPRHMHDEMRRVRYLGSARSGTGHLAAMRLTSLALVPLTIGFVWVVLSLVGKSYDEAHAYMARPAPAIVMLLLLVAGIYHMQLGMRTIIEDYVHGEHAKDWSLAANLFFALLVGTVCVYAVFRLSFV